MKKVVLSAFVCLSILSCKKKEEAPVSIVSTGPVKHCTATINGSAFTSDSYSSFYGGLPEYNISCGNQSAGNPSIELSGKIQTGIHPVGVFPNYFGGMYRINNVTYTAKSGSFNITTNDTLNGLSKHFTAKFNFSTDTISGTSYQITNGDVDYF